MLMIEQRDVDGVRIVALRGEAGAAESMNLAAEMLKLAQRRPERLVFDLSALSFISSLALGEFVSVANRLSRMDCRVALAAAPPRVLGVLQQLRFEQLFELFPSVDAAMDSFTTHAP